MKRKLHYLILSLVLTSFCSFVFGQGTTTSGINGRVADEKGESLPGSTVIAIHEPTGSQFAGITNSKGIFNIPNMDVGGPYSITISYVGYEDVIHKNVYLSLGQTFEIKQTLNTESQNIDEVVVTAQINNRDLFDGNRTGAETVISAEQLEILPTVDRRISDFARLTPQASISEGAISIAGQNNRYNSIMIDGAVNNDVYGLSPTGTNGGQTGLSPISMDAIEQFQIVLAPYDVRQSGFTGGGINAVTRRGTNKLTGSAYYLTRNESLSGRTPTDNPDLEREKLDPYTSSTIGLRLGGALIKNKLFVFGSYERLRQETPQPFTFDTGAYRGIATYDQLTRDIPAKLQTMNYSTGGFEANTQKTESDKLLFRLDYNISNRHRLMLRHSFTKNASTSPGRSTNSRINYYNNGVYFPSTTNVTAAELKSNFDKTSNSLMVTYTSVLDDRDPIGQDFPSVLIQDGTARAEIHFGSEAYSTGNQLKQKTLTITDNFTLYKGRHTLTFGTHNEIGKAYNLFIRRAYGEYRYSSVQDFLNDSLSNRFRRSYSLVDNVTGDGTKAAAEFGLVQLGFYAQDEWQVKNNFKLTYGIRVDIPIFTDDPKAIAQFDTTLAKFESAGVKTYGARSGKMPDLQLMFAPRIGFNWDVFEDKTLQMRGGIGMFTSRLPLVWPGGAYINNGQIIGNYQASNVHRLVDNFDPYNQPPIPKPASKIGGQVDLYSKDFKFPQVVRTSLAVDKKLPWDLVGTIEGIYSKTINNGIYYNLNIRPSDKNMTGNGNDNRPLYNGYGSRIESTYDHVIVGANTNKGYSYNLTAQLQKYFSTGISGSVAYNFGRSMVMNDNESSQNSSQWRYLQSVRGRNNLDLSISNFDVGHRIVANIAYKIDYSDFGRTILSLFYNGQSGRPYSFVYTENVIGDDFWNAENDLIYVPASRSEIALVDIVDEDTKEVTRTAEQQWADLQSYVDNDKYLKSRKGDYVERNGARMPFTHVVDFKVIQDIYVTKGDYTHTLQLTFDVFNLTNLINKDWGRTHFITNRNYGLITPVGFDTDGTTMQYNFDKPSDDPHQIDDAGINSSRWHAQIGVRYIF